MFERAKRLITKLVQFTFHFTQDFLTDIKLGFTPLSARLRIGIKVI